MRTIGPVEQRDHIGQIKQLLRMKSCIRVKMQTQIIFTILPEYKRKLLGDLPSMSLRNTRDRVTQCTVLWLFGFPQAPGLPCPMSPALHVSWAGSPFTPGPPTSPLCFLCSSFKVTLGAHDIEKQETTQQNFSVKAAIPHPDYNPKNYSNDIMLLKVREPPLCSYSPGSRLFPLPLGPVPSLLPIPAT